MADGPIVELRTGADWVMFDRDNGALFSMAPTWREDTDVLRWPPTQPAFALQYLEEGGEYRYLDSRDAHPPVFRLTDDGDQQQLDLQFSRIGGLDLDVTLTIRARTDDRLSRWRATVRNRAGLRIVDLQYPFVVVPAAGAVAIPSGHGGQLVQSEGLAHLAVDEPARWQFVPENGNSFHYPGHLFAQFLAWSHEGVGLYLACEDEEANVKLLRALRRDSGIRLGIAHVGDWPEDGERTLEYDTVLGSFEGDWMDAAAIYREWGLSRKWAIPLTKRTDVPRWLLDSPPHITIRLQGYLDDGPAPPIAEFLPYEKCVPLLEGIAEKVEAPLVAVLMSWERGGPWVYPDCFPPVGGDESLARFCALARERGWHIGSFCNGTRWVTQHLFCDYDGRAYYEEQGGEESVCRRRDGEPWAEVWDATWRPSYICCMAQDKTRRIASDFVARLVGWGMESIQFFDQNCNAATFPCFATDHGHPSMPGKWMAAAMRGMIEEFHRRAAEAGESAVIHSTENPCNEVCLPLFQQSDARPSAPSSGQGDYVPIFPFIYHECAILHGMMSVGPDPYALEIRTAMSGVLGSIPGAVMTGDGTLLNRETWNWAEWEPRVGSSEDPLEMMRSVTELRRGAGRDFLVYGRMQRPAQVAGIDTVEWDFGGRHRAVPAVLHSAWTAPDGRHAVVLANWTREPRTVVVTDWRLVSRVRLQLTGAQPQELVASGGVSVTVPALGCALIEAADTRS